MEEIKELLENEVVSIVDVRNPMEFNMDNIKGAINIPLPEIMSRIEEFKSLPKPIIVHCLSGGRSATAVSILKQMGIDEVYNGGGIAYMKSMME